MKKIAMFGGSFNPVHNAHTSFAKKVIDSQNLDLLYVVPTYSSPHKTGADMASPYDRLNMCKLAFKNMERTYVSDIEIKRGGNSFTCDTLSQLKQLYPNDDLYFVVGADMYITLQNWKNPEKIFSLAKIITFPRNNDDYYSLKEHSEFLKKMGAETVILNEPVFMLSATEVRNNIKDINYSKEHINSDVYDYIVNNNLYGM